MKTYILFCCLFISGLAVAQDTIYKRSGELISAKITEISSAEVKYKRFTMQDGPLFVIARNDVRQIKFANGVIDTFTVVEPVVSQLPPVVSQPPVYLHSQVVNLPPGAIQNPRSGIYYYNNGRIDEKRMLFLAADKNRTWKNKELMQAIVATRDYKNNQYISGFGGPVIALACVLIASQTNQTNTNSVTASALTFNSLGIFIASQIVSPIFKRKRAQSARRVVDLYNSELSK